MIATSIVRGRGGIGRGDIAENQRHGNQQRKDQLDDQGAATLGELDQLPLPDSAGEHYFGSAGKATPVSFKKRSPRFGRRTRMLLTRSAVPLRTASTWAGFAPRVRMMWTVSPSTVAAWTSGSERRFSSPTGEVTCRCTSFA